MQCRIKYKFITLIVVYSDKMVYSTHCKTVLCKKNICCLTHFTTENN